MYQRMARGDFEDQTPEATASVRVSDVNRMRGRPITWRDLGWVSALMAGRTAASLLKTPRVKAPL